MSAFVYNLDQFRELVNQLNASDTDIKGKLIFNAGSQNERLVLKPENNGRFVLKKNDAVMPYLTFDHSNNETFAEFPNKMNFKNMHGDVVFSMSNTSVSVTSMALTGPLQGENVITSNNIASNSINSSHILDSAVTFTKLAPNVISQALATSSEISIGTSNANPTVLNVVAPFSIKRPSQLPHITLSNSSVEIGYPTTFNSNIDVKGQILVNGAPPVYSQWVSTGSNIYFSTSSNNSNVGIGITTPQYKLHVAGDVFATNTVTFSDQRYKTDIAPISNGLEKVLSLRGYTYKFIEGDSDRKYAGVMAQEVQAVLPEVINTDSEGKLSVAYGNMAGLFIEAIRDLKAEIEDIKAKIGL